MVVMLVAVAGCQTLGPTSTPVPTSTPLPTATPTPVPDWRNDLPQTMEACDAAVGYLKGEMAQAYRNWVEHHGSKNIDNSRLTSVAKDRAYDQWDAENKHLSRTFHQAAQVLQYEVSIHCREIGWEPVTPTPVSDLRNDLPQTAEACGESVGYLWEESARAYLIASGPHAGLVHYDLGNLSAWASSEDSLRRTFEKVTKLRNDVLGHCRELGWAK